jgi:hypothetical protein
MRTNEISQYDQQAQDFLAKHGLKFRASLSDTKTPAWAKDGEETGHHYRITLSRAARLEKVAGATTPMKMPPTRLVFDFWNSVNAAQKLKEASKRLTDYQLQKRNAEGDFKTGYTRMDGSVTMWSQKEMDEREAAVNACHPSDYDVLACISSDAYTPETFADFCAEYGYEKDSIKALQQYRRCLNFSRMLKAFFTEKELNELSEIQ